MSQRVKKPGRLYESQGKRRRRRPSGSDGEEDGTRSGSNSGGNSSFPSIGGMWTPRHLSDLKVSSIYNRNSAEAPAEVRSAVTSLYRKDLISAMKLADSEPLTPEEYWLITDPWKQEWEKGVQVPVNPESLPEPEVVVISPVNERSHDFRLPKKKYIRVTHDDFFNPDYHQLVSTAARAEKVCSYDLDDVDAAWLSCANADRGMQTLTVISEFLMEQVIEELELQCWEQVQTILKSQEGLGIEYDENVICDVCRSPESEEGNEMVFCDACNICVHQACYGITTIPSGSWLCRTCTLGIRPSCVLCPNMGGAMKATRSGQKWAHVACAIWIPEVSIGSVEKMEPITKISAIPQSRWSLICVLCKDKTGACIQCSVKTCKTAYHVTCAFKSGLEMKPIIVDENAEDGIKLRSYCQKHSVNTKKEKTTNSGSDDDSEKKKARAMTAEERNQARAEKLQQIEAEFYKYVRLKDVSQNLAVDMDIVLLIFNYWKLKRKSLNNRPLVPPRPETTQLLTQQQEQDLEQMKMFVQLRQDLERVRNLCYMVSRREKFSRTYFRLREQTFQKQVAILGEATVDFSNSSPQEQRAILDANHGPSIYDQIYSHSGANSAKDYETLISLIAGEEKKDKLVNGVIKPKKSCGLDNLMNSATNPYKRQFVNGARRKNLMGESCSSLSESEASASDTGAASTAVNNRKPKLSPSTSGRKPLSYLFELSDSSVDDTVGEPNVKSEKGIVKAAKGRSRSLKSKKSAKKSSTSDSDELEIPVPKSLGGNAKKSEAPIYSDSDTDESPKRQKSPVASKPAVKDLNRKSNKKPAPVLGTTVAKSPPKGKLKGPGRKKKGFEPTELIVPQREAAKKATESIRSVKPKKDATSGVESSVNETSAAPSSPSINLKDRDVSSDRSGEGKKSTTSEKDKTKNLKGGDKSKSPARKVASKKSKTVKASGQLPEDENQLLHSADSRDQYDFDLSNDDSSSKNVTSYVPQRQAAKKAAEHIRSGLSNIVAARLIIEDEMEAARKKPKGDKQLANVKKPLESPSIISTILSGKKLKQSKGKSSPDLGDPIDSATEKSDEVGKGKTKKRSPTKGDESKGKVKGTKKDLMSTEESGKKGDTDWPFLDRGSQSACRRSRERSSSSSSSSSSGSSSTDSSSSSRSSASSRSSSPASASPKSNAIPRTTSPIPPCTPAAASKTTSITPKGPGRKLKTSDRSPGSGTEYETPKGKKPAPKSRGPAKLRPGRATASDTKSLSDSRSTQPSNNVERPGDSGRSRKTTRSSSSSSSSSSPSPTSSSRKRNKSSEEEIKRRTRKSTEASETSKKNSFNFPGNSEIGTKSPRAAKAKTPVKTNEKVQSSGILDLSSDSEVESPTKSLPSKSPKHIVAHGKENKESTSQPSNNELKGSRTPRGRKKGSASVVSENEKEGAENEKENSCLTPETSVLDPSTSNSTKSRNAAKTNVPPCVGSILSPLTPSSENKEKEQSTISKSSDTEPDLKRPRLDTSSSSQPSSQSVAPNSNESASVNSSALTGNQHHSKSSLFSPSRLANDSELLDFDTELSDLARSFSADYSQCDEDGSAAGGSGTLQFPFPQNMLFREDNSEDSAQATLNLVEKLRLQHARKSGCPRSSMDGSEFSMLEDSSKSPCSARQNSETSIKDTSILSSGSGNDLPSALGSEGVFDESAKSSVAISKVSPGKDKLALGDERWVPPSEESSENTVSPVVLKEVEPLKTTTQPPTPMSEGSGVEVPAVTKDVLLGFDKDKDSSQLRPEFLQSELRDSHQSRSLCDRHENEENTQLSRSDIVDDLVSIHRDTSISATLSMETLTPDSSAPVPASTGLNLPHGVHITKVGGTGSSAASSFIYPISSVPSSNSVLNSLTSGAAPNNSLFRPHSQPHVPSSSSTLPQGTQSSLPPGFSRQNFTSTPFLHSQQQQSQVSDQKGKEMSSAVGSPSSISPGSGTSQCRVSEFVGDKSISDSMVSSMTAGMPPLAKPTIASPSMILAANHVKSIVPPPPPQSTVAQIIENVVNNHTNNSNFSANATQELLSAMLNMSSSGVSCVGASNSGFSNQNTRSRKSPMKSPFSCGMLASIETELAESISNAKEKTKDTSVLRENMDGKCKEDLADVGNIPHNINVSPRGRGRRATTPRGQKSNDKILTACETNGLKGKGRGERKSTSSTSPARAKPAPRRGGGKGRGKGKVVGTRKDLAGTVYDIDFDEFEENLDEKLDLRMLRERRKSSDIHAEMKFSKSENILSPVDVRSSGTESSPKIKDMEATRSLSSHLKAQQNLSLTPNTVPTNDTSITPILQPLLPGPVDMRTYSVGSVSSEELISGVQKSSKVDTPRKQAKALDISSVFSSSSTKQPIVNEFEELDQTLDALSSAPKSVPVLSISKISNVQETNQQLPATNAFGEALPSKTLSNFMMSEHCTGDITHEPDFKTSTDFSRNQLKVKIKGPFLDANYGSHSITGDVPSGPPHFQNSFHHPTNPSQMIGNVPTNNTSSLRRMRKKELLRQYWTQDMNMDGSMCGPMHEADMGGMTGSSMSHPINRSVITIPKAVASMAIIPTKDDYRESLPGDNLLGSSLTGLSKDIAGLGQAVEKKKRSRGMREMVALGILTNDSPRERRRDRMETSLSGSSFTPEMGKKRGKSNKRPIRSTFIPPTLVESDASTGDKKPSTPKNSNSSNLSSKAMSTVVTAVNHPTPKLKIKFGDLSRAIGGSGSPSTTANHVHSDSSDKETPNKKAKGRPPKKRGISELPSAAPPTMEELKRQSMKYREMIMQDFAVEERKEILKLRGTRKHKKHKRKGGAPGSETDEGGRPKSPEVKVISEGSKLILRFGKSRPTAGTSDAATPDIKIKGNGPDIPEDILGTENDSGFTGSSEGSSGSVSELTGASKDLMSTPTLPVASMSIKVETNNGGSGDISESNSATLGPSEVRSDLVSYGTSLLSTAANTPPASALPDLGCDFPSQPIDVKPLAASTPEPPDFSKNSDKKLMPIRLKLSRCFEGYALKKKQEGCAGEGGPPGSTPTKQSDSCEVR